VRNCPEKKSSKKSFGNSLKLHSSLKSNFVPTSRILFSVDSPCVESTDSTAFVRHLGPYQASFVAEQNLLVLVGVDMTLKIDGNERKKNESEINVGGKLITKCGKC
jgi:hypothetical protein